MINRDPFLISHYFHLFCPQKTKEKVRPNTNADRMDVLLKWVLSQKQNGNVFTDFTLALNSAAELPL